MLENLARKKSLTTAPTTRCRSCAAFAGAPHGGPLEFPRRASRTFPSAVKGIAKHPRHRVFAAQKVHLKTVRLFFRARLGVNAADIRFRIGIRSSSHELLPNNYFKQRGNQRVAIFLLQQSFFRRRQIPRAPFFFILTGRQEHVTRMP